MEAKDRKLLDMKIAITGHSEGIGKCFAEILADQGHEIVGRSRRTGHNMRRLQKLVGPIVECDWLIKNAHSRLDQAEVMQKVLHQWHDTKKISWHISCGMST